MFDIETALTCTSLPDILLASIAIPAALTLGLLVRYLVDSNKIRSNGIPGPLLAKLSDAWLGWTAAHGHRSEIVHALHEKYGQFVRLAPNHVSINSTEALHTIYTHGAKGGLKSDFYDAFLSVAPAIFSTRSKAEHTRKRKMVAHIFSQKSVTDFEPYIQFHVDKLFKHWDRMCELSLKGLAGEEGEGWEGKESSGRVWFDCLPWYNYLALDTITDLAFGAPFGLLDRAKDSVLVASNQKTAMSTYTKRETSEVLPVKEVSAMKILHERGEYSASIGVLPLWSRQIITTLIPWYYRRKGSVGDISGVAVAAVSKRLSNPSDRVDLLSKLQEGKDDEGEPMGAEELTAEAQTYIVAGTDTTANTTCVITYYLALNPSIQTKLQEELDQAFSSFDDSEDYDATVVSYNQIKNLHYLEAVINESMRLFSTAGLGLPRVAPEGGISVLGKYFPEGTVLSVPTYSLHRDKEVWGEDVESLRPERWLERDSSALLKSFNPFSVGPRSCIGRNLANMELRIFIASIFRRYEFVLESPDLEVSEGFLRKPSACRVGMRRRGGTLN